MSHIDPRIQRPIITGKPDGQRTTPPVKTTTAPSTSFQELLQQRLQTQTQTQDITLSKHAQVRTIQRGIELGEAQMERLEQAVNLAQDKGLDDALVMMDNNAFIVNISNRVIVTVVDGEESQEPTVFTNIDGAVII